MNILLVSASQRADSNSIEVARYIQSYTLNVLNSVQSVILDLSLYPSLLDHYGAGSENSALLARDKDEVLSLLYACDAVVFITPEWGGMIPPALVNLLLLSANGSANGLPLAHKPAFAIGISTSGGGSHPISLLKGYTAKNSHLAWLPSHAIIQNVETFLTQAWTPTNDDRVSQVQSRLLVGIKSLIIYAEQLKPVRSDLLALSKAHPFGQ